MDYTGGGLHALSQINTHVDLLSHSGNVPWRTTTALIDRAGTRVLHYFRAPLDKYEGIFTPNATGALKLIAETYAFQPGARFLLTADNHNSVNGIREFARQRGAEFQVRADPWTRPEDRRRRTA